MVFNDRQLLRTSFHYRCGLRPRPANIEAATSKYVRANGQHHVPRLRDEGLGCHAELGLGRVLDQGCQTTDEDTPRASLFFRRLWSISNATSWPAAACERKPVPTRARTRPS